MRRLAELRHAATALGKAPETLKRTVETTRATLNRLFPERLLYVRTNEELKSFVISPRVQMMAACGVAGLALWMGVCTAGLLVSMVSANAADREVARTQAKYERWIADRQARLNSAVAQLNAASGSTNALATEVENRHAALAMLLTQVKSEPGVAQALTPAIDKALRGSLNATPVQRVEMIRLSQEKLLDAADSFAKSRAERLRLAFRMAGLQPSAYVSQRDALGGPLIESKDPRALAAVLDVDENFAVRIQRAANELSEAKSLTESARRMPFARPLERGAQTSGFGVRSDPFTRRPALHAGLDFSGGHMTPIQATAPGVVSFTGVRSGYGNTVELDHGRGFKTRYAHLAAISVRPGQRVALGQRLGGMGSTGRSTGTHLHYEVWVNGKARNPAPFVRAGAYVG